MNTKLLKIIGLTLILIASLGTIQNFLEINDTQALRAGAPPPPPPPPPPGPGPIGKKILTRAIMRKISDGTDLGDEKAKIVKELKDRPNAIAGTGVLARDDNFANIRKFLEDNNCVKAKEAFEKKITEFEEMGGTAGTQEPAKPKKPKDMGGKVMGDPTAVAQVRNIRELIGFIKNQQTINTASADTISKILELDVVKNLEAQGDPITLDTEKFNKTLVSDVIEKLKKQLATLKEEEAAQETALARKAVIDASVKKNVENLKGLYQPNADDLSKAFTFPTTVGDLSEQEKQLIITKSWDDYINTVKYKPIFYIIQFKIYDSKTKDIFRAANLEGKFTQISSENSTLINNIKRLIIAIDPQLEIDKLTEEWGKLKPAKNNLPIRFIQHLQDKLFKIDPDLIAKNKDKIKPIFTTLFKTGEIPEDLKQALGIKATIKTGGAKTVQEEIEALKKDFVKTIFENLTPRQLTTLSSLITMRSDILQELNLTRPNTGQLFNAIKAYNPAEKPAEPPLPHHKTAPTKTDLNIQLETLKDSLSQLKTSLESLAGKLGVLKGKL